MKNLPRGCVFAPADAVEILNRDLGDMLPWEFQTYRALQKLAFKHEGRWSLKVGDKAAKAMAKEATK